MNLIECNKCGWCYFPVDLEYIITWEKDWIGHFEKMDQTTRGYYGLTDTPPKIEDEYLNCQCGNTHKDFKDSNKVLDGHTISGILDYRLDFKR
jgi:hypothetical protein